MRSAENLSAKRLNIISRAVADALMEVKWIRMAPNGVGRFHWRNVGRKYRRKKTPPALNAILSAFRQVGFFTLLYN
jgi:hypothetical protein